MNDKETLIKLIWKYADKNKMKPSIRDLQKIDRSISLDKQRQIKKYGKPILEIINECNLPYSKTKGKPLLYSDEELLSLLQNLIDRLGRMPSYNEIDCCEEMPSSNTYKNRFGNIEDVAKNCNVKESIVVGRKADKEFLLNELKRFYQEFDRIPTQKDFEKLDGYPSRKTFTNHFGKFNDALKLAGFNVKDKPEYTREYLLSEIKRFIDEFGRQPYAHDMDKVKGYPTKNRYIKVFGSWNNALKELGLKVKVSHYTDEELEYCFRKFVKKHGRTPSIHEFNNTNEYPSFWCYQNRFSSWNNAVEYYGYKVNEGASGSHFVFENGEVCKSTHEYDVSKWLRKNNISYLRNTPYRDFVDSYDGKKDCDYMIMHNTELIFLEIAGLYTSREKKSSMEKDYIKRFNHKIEHLLVELNHKILYPDDFKKKTLDEMFSFLFEIKRPEWFTYEEIYRGVCEDYMEV